MISPIACTLIWRLPSPSNRIVLINNNGYTIERYINGMHAGYNWVQPWRYLESARYFGAPENDPEYPVFNKRVEMNTARLLHS
jgi:TPP-dependent 2-oxoacid decarboxylase